MSDLDRLQLVQASARVEMERASRELRDLKEEAAQLRRENKALRSTLRIQNTTRGNGVVPLAASGSAPSVSDPSTDIQRKEVSTLQQQVFALRSKLDETRSSALKKQKVYEEISEKNRELEGEREPILNPTNPLNMKVHMLENRLDKSMVKFNEAMNIRRTYEAIVRKLQEERVTYDKQLASIEKTLHTKETDLKELSNMCRNATNARDIAKAELAQFKLNLEEERKKRQKDLEERRAMVQARKERLKTTRKMNEPKPVVESVRKESDEEIRARQVEEERKEEERICLAQYVSDFQMIREVTGAETAEEVIMKFIAQQDTSVTLTDMSKDAQAKLETLTAERAELRARLEDALFRGSGHMSSRRVLDEFRVHLSEAKMEAARTREEYEDLSNILVNCKAGVLHVRNTLAFDSKSSDISTTGGDTANAQNTTEDTAEILRAVGEKLQTLIEEAAQLPSVEAVTSAAADHNSIPTHTMAPNVPKNNLRIRLTDRDDEGGDTMDEEEEGDEDVYDRERVKKFAQIAVLRETKRRNKKKKTPEE